MLGSQRPCFEIGMSEIFLCLAGIGGEEAIDAPGAPVTHADAAEVAMPLRADHLVRAIAARYRPAEPIDRLRGCAGAAGLGHDVNNSRRYAGVGHRAHCGALRRIVMALALGAFHRVDHIHAALHADRRVRALKFAGAAHRALRVNDLISHDQFPSACLSSYPSLRVSEDASGPARLRHRAVFACVMRGNRTLDVLVGPFIADSDAGARKLLFRTLADLCAQHDIDAFEGADDIIEAGVLTEAAL